MQPLSVTTLNNQIKSLLETHYLNILVEGEASRVTYHSSGHLYFTLKDERSAISCVMFKGNNQRLKFRLEEGMQVIVGGGISVYTPRGSYQINCATLEPSGSGALAKAYEQLKKRLEAKGYFDTSVKKPLPRYPRHIVIVTSRSGAAIQDMYRVAKKRWPLLKLTLIDTTVQGEGAARMIACNIAVADTLGADAIVVGRGGGSLEDLWAFNEESVAEAIFAAKTPVVSAVGHEIDFLISDFVADLRAPTPSAAMELILPDMTEVLMGIDNLSDNYYTAVTTIFHKKEQQLLHLKQLFEQNSVEAKLSLYRQEIDNLQREFQSFFSLGLQKRAATLTQLKERLRQYRPDQRVEQYRADAAQLKTEFDHFMKLTLLKKEQTLTSLARAFENNDPAKRDRTGIAQITKNGKKIALERLHEGDTFHAESAKVKITAEVKEKQNL
ncbi:MAG: exodeoxyribonuclease VII large subunit [Sulfurospirillum sp.]|nr:MAG: exodeoxyribonuclease VII large subunit [Sulfurospirillum sp.]